MGSPGRCCVVTDDDRGTAISFDFIIVKMMGADNWFKNRPVGSRAALMRSTRFWYAHRDMTENKTYDTDRVCEIGEVGKAGAVDEAGSHLPQLWVGGAG